MHDYEHDAENFKVVLRENQSSSGKSALFWMYFKPHRLVSYLNWYFKPIALRIYIGYFWRVGHKAILYFRLSKIAYKVIKLNAA